MSYHDDYGSGCVNGILFIVFVFFIGFISLKGCVSCADEAYRSCDRWRNNKQSKESNNNLLYHNNSPIERNMYLERQQYYNRVRFKEKIVVTYEKCSFCNGTGKPVCHTCNGRKLIKTKCWYCQGTGKSSRLVPDEVKLELKEVPCSCGECSGTGWKDTYCNDCSPLDIICEKCNGRGVISVTKTIKVPE